MSFAAISYFVPFFVAVALRILISIDKWESEKSASSCVFPKQSFLAEYTKCIFSRYHSSRLSVRWRSALPIGFMSYKFWWWHIGTVKMKRRIWARECTSIPKTFHRKQKEQERRWNLFAGQCREEVFAKIRFKDRLFLYFDNNKHRRMIKNISRFQWDVRAAEAGGEGKAEWGWCRRLSEWKMSERSDGWESLCCALALASFW